MLFDRRSLKLLLALCVVVPFSFGGDAMSAPAAAPAIAPSTCDADYYNTLKSRAWLEAQREITQNQNLIAKPDSVLRFSCFDKMMDDFQSAYSATSDVSVAKSAASSFVADNFNAAHSNMIGGRSDETSSLDSSCDVMAKVWEDAQCMNFADEPDNDAFFTLAEYNAASDDKRFEGNCSKPGGWSSELDALMPANTPWTEDDIVTFMKELDVSQTTCSASKTIDVGVNAISSSEDFQGEYEVKVCLVHGCYYKPKSKTSGECVEPPTS